MFPFFLFIWGRGEREAVELESSHLFLPYTVSPQRYMYMSCTYGRYASCGACGQVLRDRVLTQPFPFKKDERRSNHKVHILESKAGQKEN